MLGEWQAICWKQRVIRIVRRETRRETGKGNKEDTQECWIRQWLWVTSILVLTMPGDQQRNRDRIPRIVRWKQLEALQRCPWPFNIDAISTNRQIATCRPPLSLVVDPSTPSAPHPRESFPDRFISFHLHSKKKKWSKGKVKDKANNAVMVDKPT